MSAAASIRALTAELIKLRTLPAVPLTMLGTALLASAVAAAFAVQAGETGGMSAASIVAETIPFAQAGAVLLGVLALGHEHAGRTLRTSLAAVPSRLRLLASKTFALLGVALLAGASAVAAAWGVAVLVGGQDVESLLRGEDIARIAGAAAYLSIIALLAHAMTMLLGGLVPALASMLAYLMLVSPLLGGLGEAARWLPERAAAQLYRLAAPAQDELHAGAAILVVLSCFAALYGAGSWRFARSEP